MFAQHGNSLSNSTNSERLKLLLKPGVEGRRQGEGELPPCQAGQGTSNVNALISGGLVTVRKNLCSTIQRAHARLDKEPFQTTCLLQAAGRQLREKLRWADRPFQIFWGKY